MKALLTYQFQSEFRKKSTLLSLLLYLLCLVFINYLTLGIAGAAGSPAVWSALFWIALLSTAVNTIAKSFVREKSGGEIYLYSLVSPGELILSRILYGGMLCLAISLAGFVLFGVLLTNPIQNTGQFLTTLVLSSFGFGASLSILSAISSRTDNSSVMMAVLSFPITIGVLLTSIKITKNAIDGLEWAASSNELLTLAAINILVGAVSYLLFPYIWRS